MSTRRRNPSKDAPGLTELLRHGWCRRDAEHLLVLELALGTVGRIGTEGGRVLSDHAATALAWEPVLCGARGLYAEPDHAAAWRALAGYQDDQRMRRLMLELAAQSDGSEVVPSAELTAEDLRLAALAVDAESRGELSEALRLLRQSQRPLDDAWTRDLERVLSYGEELTAAQWGRYLCSAALRWCQSTERGLDLGVHYAAIALRALGADEQVVTEHAPARAAYDQLVHDALLFDEGGLREYVSRELAPALAEHVPGLLSWSDAPLTVVRVVARAADGTVVEDVLDGVKHLVGDRRLGEQHPVGRLLVGRLTQVEGEATRCFATLPTVIQDECTALELAVGERDGADAGLRLALVHGRLGRTDSEAS